VQINEQLLAAAYEQVTSAADEGDELLNLPAAEEDKIDARTNNLIQWLSDNIDFAEDLGAQYTEEEKQGEILRIGFVLTFLMGVTYARSEALSSSADLEFTPVTRDGDRFEFSLRGTRADVEKFLTNMIDADEEY
jgi:hypothetical protein